MQRNWGAYGKDYEWYVKHVYVYIHINVYFQPKKPLQDGEFFVIMYANVMRNSVQELSLTMIISFATKYQMI